MRITNVITMITLLAFVSACGGRTANPVMASQYGDREKSCAGLEVELSGIEQEIQRLMPKTNKTGKNVALGVAGAFLLVPWFFMDLSQAEQEEINAYRNRYNNLLSIAADKKCSLKHKEIPAFETETKPVKTEKRKKN